MRHWQLQVTRAWGGYRADLRGSTRELHMTCWNQCGGLESGPSPTGERRERPAQPCVSESSRSGRHPLAAKGKVKKKKLVFQLGLPGAVPFDPFPPLGSLPQIASRSPAWAGMSGCLNEKSGPCPGLPACPPQCCWAVDSASVHSLRGAKANLDGYDGSMRSMTMPATSRCAQFSVLTSLMMYTTTPVGICQYSAFCWPFLHLD